MIPIKLFQEILEMMLHRKVTIAEPEPKIYKLPISHCPQCGMTINSTSIISGEESNPKPGECGVCDNCGELMAFNQDMTVRPCELNDMMALTTEEQHELMLAQREIRCRKK